MDKRTTTKVRELTANDLGLKDEDFISWGEHEDYCLAGVLQDDRLCTCLKAPVRDSR